MQIWTTRERFGYPRGMALPAIVLRSDQWDDFHYQPTFQAELQLPDSDAIFLGTVKIMHLGLAESSDVLDLPKNFRELDSNYCSLGQALSYYENLLAHLPRADALAYLKGIRDVAADPSLIERFSSEPAFKTSLLREGSARRALSDAPKLLSGDALSQALKFEFTTSVGGEEFALQFLFGDTDQIPARINGVIGYNGAGKTRLLANLAHVASLDVRTRSQVAPKLGKLHPPDVAFGRVVAISYSAFDTFDVPRTKSDSSAYVYCGLRDVKSSDNTGRLKSASEITKEISTALQRMRTDDRWQSLDRALAPLFREPSFQLSSMVLDFRSPASEWTAAFEKLSTGHKISLNVVVQLVAQLENNSLVLIDEPESHLHPPLLAALMNGISEALDETNSFAIIATHSPVVLQEIAARHVRVMRRYGTRTTVESPRSETFGENVGILTRTVFNLDNAQSDYEGVLTRLGATLGVEGVGTVFPAGLSSQALALVMEAESEAQQEDM